MAASLCRTYHAAGEILGRDAEERKNGPAPPSLKHNYLDYPPGPVEAVLPPPKKRLAVLTSHLVSRSGNLADAMALSKDSSDSSATGADG